ncbi:glycoside hydrolase family 3 N-terminal domain-containing protein [Niveispirillum sp. BGYR6]|uniref:glycoside hydrolase family 3 protein n=1 Tax=Niveispirillum sp. BGYR6 TaxID=2971249 RepID=UPI0022B9826B|nr:glycoside hydrolase family 3 N-terminal domain-containing protein [Niveispirillum sp. BGYR6]MDG5493550.1 glycoside hydrolase family 3 N-terminal domain-containing protein [Niveispirillum sp. BGYR6]
MHKQFKRLLLLGVLPFAALTAFAAPQQPVLPADGAQVNVDGLRFRDLDRDGKLSPFEDWRLSAQARAADLVARMTLAEKAGAAVHGTAPVQGGPLSPGPAYDTPAAEAIIRDQHVNSLITRMAIAPADFAAENNRLQMIAAGTRLGIPLTISTDPRNHFQVVGGASVKASGFSQWPETLGFGALDDPALTRHFADRIRAEYRAVGIHMALSPQADLATEPRWSRINGTFGEDPARVGAQVKAYVQGMQGGDKGLAPGGVTTVVKHWVGYGAQIDGFDGHNYYGRFTDFTKGGFDRHVAAFLGAFEAGVTGVMPTYTIQKGLSLDGKPVEAVSGGYNKQMLTDLLRGTHKFKGLILSDWAITNDCNESCRTGNPPQQPKDIATPWGVEDLTQPQRYAKGMLAGIDQFGGVNDGLPLLAAVKQGLLPEARLNAAVATIMELKFEQGLFENPFVDPAAAPGIIGRADVLAEGRQVQAKALVMLENRLGPAPLPAGGGKRLFIHGVDEAAAKAAGFTIVASPDQADIALIRLKTPFQTLHPNHFFGRMQHEGDIDFKEGDAGLALVRQAAAKVPVIVTVYMDRPAILTNIKPHAATLIAEFGATDAALFDALTGKVAPQGRLPFELPSNMQSVAKQSPALPADSGDPLYKIGFRHGS